MNEEQEETRKNGFDGTVRPLTADDISHLKPILEMWIRDSETGELKVGEMNEALEAMKESLKETNGRKYFAAETAPGEVVGVMGHLIPRPKMLQFALTDKPAEIINAYVSADHRVKGVGRALIDTIEENLKRDGYKEVLVNSGPRYEKTAFGFYNKLFGPAVGTIKDLYGPGVDATVWRKVL